MRHSNSGGEGSATLGQVFAAIGILVGLAITVPVLGILLMPVMAIASVVRALAGAAREAVAAQRQRAPARAAAAPRALGASYSSL